MKKMAFLVTILFFGTMLHSRQVVNLEEGKPYVYNGLEYGYYITNEQSKEVKGEDYEQYKIKAKDQK